MSASGSYLTLNALRIGRLFVMSTGEPLYGYQIIQNAGVNYQSGYRILWDLEQTNVLSSQRESMFDAVATKRPARRLYRITEQGVNIMRSALASLQISST